MDHNLDRALGRLEGKVDALLQLTVDHNNDLAHVRTRIEALERWRTWLAGATAAGIAATSTLVGLIWRLFQYFTPGNP